MEFLSYILMFHEKSMINYFEKIIKMNLLDKI